LPAHINAIGTATPPHQVHEAFRGWAERRITDPRVRKLFDRMADRAGIEQRWSVLPATSFSAGQGGFYADDGHPSTATRMRRYAADAPDLALAAVAALPALGRISHLVVASCTGFMAPGLDQIIAARLGLDPSVERVVIGFMGCYAAVTALRTAHHIVRSEPRARVLVVSTELCTLHLQPTAELEPILAMLQFGDGAGAAIVSADPVGLALGAHFATTLEASAELIRWTIGDTGFAMHLAGAVPGRIGEALGDQRLRETILGEAPVDSWAVHPGGRSILDAVELGFGLDPAALAASRAVLRTCGNMSSATLLFVLQRIMANRSTGNGVALAFGPGLAAEGFRFGPPS
jgi:alpha-pyrone synthase